MISKTKRQFSDEEKQKLRHVLPSFLFRSRRKIAQQEIDEGVAEVLELQVERAWDMNGCRPPCCPHIYLLQVGETEFVYTESWTAFDDVGDKFPRRRVRIVRSPITKRILSLEAEGAVLSLEDNPFDPATDYFDQGAECEVLQEKDMSEAARSALATT